MATMKNTRQISLLAVMWFLVGLSILVCSMFGETRLRTNQLINVALWVLLADLVIYLPILQIFKSISSAYLTMFVIVLLPYVILVYISQYLISSSKNPAKTIVIPVVVFLIMVDIIFRFYFQKNKLKLDFNKSAEKFGIDKNKHVGTFDLMLPGDSKEWFYGNGKLFQSLLALTPIIIRVILRSNGMISDPLTHGLLLSSAVIVFNEEVFKLLFLGMLLKKMETDTGQVILRK